MFWRQIGRLPPLHLLWIRSKVSKKGAENDEMTENNILDDDQSDEIYNLVVEQKTSEEVDAGRRRPIPLPHPCKYVKWNKNWMTQKFSNLI